MDSVLDRGHGGGRGTEVGRAPLPLGRHVMYAEAVLHAVCVCVAAWGARGRLALCRSSSRGGAVRVRAPGPCDTAVRGTLKFVQQAYNPGNAVFAGTG